MAFNFLDKDNLLDQFNKAKTYMTSVFDPLDEFDRIARNRHHPDIGEGLPTVTEGTTSSIIHKTPRRIIQQIPTGVVKGDIDDWLSIVAEFAFLKHIIPNANYQFSLLQKSWNVVKKGLTYGSQPTMTLFMNKGNYFCTDLALPFIKDVFFEPGKVSDTDSNIIFVRSFYQQKDIDWIIYREKRLKDQAKERGESYESEWNAAALRRIREELTTRSDNDTPAGDKERNIEKRGVEIIHAFQRGVGAEFYSFHPRTEDIVRTKINKDPRGEFPLQSFYADTDGSNPLGWGLVEQIGAIQNLLDSEVQMYQFNRALMLNPPIIKRGNFPKSAVKFIPNHIIDLGTDPNASIEALKIDTSSLANFAQNFGLLKSQLLNLASSPDTSISAEVGNPGFSKTPQGVKMMQATLSVDDNYVRKQYETWFERWAESAINLYFAERSGIEEIQLDKETADKLREVMPEMVNENDMIRIDWDDATPKLKFEVDASTSAVKDNQTQIEALDGLMTRVEKSALLQRIIGPEKIVAVWNATVDASGVENPEKVKVSAEELEQLRQAEEMAQQQQQALPQGPEGQAPDPTVELQQLGLDEEQIANILAKVQAGMTLEDAIKEAAMEQANAA